MRPISTERNALRHPLDEILGTESHVRLVRVLAQAAGAPLAAPEAAKRAGLTPAGARKALGRLEEVGVVERVGAGRTRQYSLSAREPLLQTLAALFLREEQRYEGVIRGLREALEGLDDLRDAWIERFPPRAGDPLEVVLVVEAESLSRVAEEAHTRVLGLEKDLDLIVELATFTRADAPEPGAGALTLLASGLAAAVQEAPPPSMYGDRDALARITHDPRVMGGRACIRGLRVTVGTIVGLLSVGRTVDEILREYPYLDAEDVQAALAYAAWRSEEIELPLKAS